MWVGVGGVIGWWGCGGMEGGGMLSEMLLCVIICYYACYYVLFWKQILNVIRDVIRCYKSDFGAFLMSLDVIRCFYDVIGNVIGIIV